MGKERPRVLTPERVWLASIAARKRGWTGIAKALKFLNYVVYRAILPYECDVAPDVRLMHRGLGVVIHPRTRIGSRVLIGHAVTIGSMVDEGSRVIIHDDVFIGAGCLLASGRGRVLNVGPRAGLGIGTVVSRDVPPDTEVRAAEPTFRANHRQGT